jgi:hypothetical protein
LTPSTRQSFDVSREDLEWIVGKPEAIQDNFLEADFWLASFPHELHAGSLLVLIASSPCNGSNPSANTFD